MHSRKHVIPVSSIHYILYSLYPVLPVSSIPCIMHSSPRTGHILSYRLPPTKVNGRAENSQQIQGLYWHAVLKPGSSEFCAVLASLSNGCLAGDQNFCRTKEDDDEGAGKGNVHCLWKPIRMKDGKGGAEVTQAVLDTFASTPFP